MVGVVLVVGQILEGYVIYPRFLGDRVELPAVWVIFALFAGGAAFGFLGIMLAVPIAATIGVLCRFWLRRYLSSPLYLDPPAAGQAHERDQAAGAAVPRAIRLHGGGFHARPVQRRRPGVAPPHRRLA